MVAADRWQRINDLFAEVLQAAEEDRARILSAGSAGDPSLGEEVAELIRAHETAGALVLDRAVIAPAGGSAKAGTIVGPYRIVRKIGEGGMGTVYLAERADEYRKKVAIKLVCPWMATEPVLRRFRTERQILADLEHPSIARLLDGGSLDGGSPYLVMEYVDGEPITRYCDRHGLTIDARLRLFRVVCTAVHYAHQNLVIHRDLKPENILVTADGVPKLLDFGIAKLLGPETGVTALTRTGLHPMTPEYASPEQVRGGHFSTTTDVYSLGVILYELLCGERPYSVPAGTPAEVERAVCGTAPLRPSTRISGGAPAVSERRATSPERLRRALAGDLDTIVLMALRKEPERRYSSAAQLSEDLACHLEGRPVSARQDAVSYRLIKLVRRNRWAVAAAALTILGLLAGTAVALWQAHQARLQKEIAEKRLNEARQFTLSLIREISEAYKAKSRTAAQELLTRKAVGYLDGLSRDAAGDARLRRDLAEAYRWLASAQGYPAGAHVGDAARARENYEKSIRLLEALGPVDRTAARDLPSAYLLYALSLLPSDVQKSLEMHRRALALFEESMAAESVAPRSLQLFRHASYCELVGERYGHPYYGNVGDTARALEYCSKALELRKAADAEASQASYERPDGPGALPDSYNLMAGMLWATGKLEEALAYQETGLRLYVERRPGTEDPMWHDELALRHVRWANLLAEDGRLEEALRHLALATDILQGLLRMDTENAAFVRDLARAHNLTAELLLRQGQLRAALESGRRGAKVGEDARAAEGEGPELRGRLADSYQVIGNVLSKQGEHSAALLSSRKALAIRESLVALDPRNARYSFLLGLNWTELGDVHAAEGQRAEAAASYGKAVAFLEPLSTRDPINVLKRRALRAAAARLEKARAGGRTRR